MIQHYSIESNQIRGKNCVENFPLEHHSTVFALLAPTLNITQHTHTHTLYGTFKLFKSILYYCVVPHIFSASNVCNATSVCIHMDIVIWQQWAKLRENSCSAVYILFLLFFSCVFMPAKKSVLCLADLLLGKPYKSHVCR